jgi:transposase
MTEEHTLEFRAMAIKKALASDNISECARELGLQPYKLNNWLKVYKKQVERGESKKLNKLQQAEIEAKDRRISELEQENEILKKAAAYFARNL